MISNLTRQLSIGFSRRPAQQGETTLCKHWRLPFQGAGRGGGEAVIVLLLESSEPFTMGNRLMSQVYEAVRRAFGDRPVESSTIRTLMDSAIQSANDLTLLETATATTVQTPRISLLLAALMPTADAGCDVTIGHVGACRAFLRRRQHIVPLTVPHTWGQENVEIGITSAADEENEDKYPYWRRPTRFLGAAQTVCVDFRLETSHTDALIDAGADCVRLQRSDSLLLCSSRLTATSLEKRQDRINARSASALAQQLIEQAALPDDSEAAAVVVGWSSSSGLLLMAAILLPVLLLLGIVTLQALGNSSSPTGATTSAETVLPTANDLNSATKLALQATDTVTPPEIAPLTPNGMPTSTQSIALAPVTVTTPPRSPTKTPKPVTPSPSPTPTASSTPTTLPIPTASPIPTTSPMEPATFAERYAVALMMPVSGESVELEAERDEVKTIRFEWKPINSDNSESSLPDGFAYELVFWFTGEESTREPFKPSTINTYMNQEFTEGLTLSNKLILNRDICWGVRAIAVGESEKMIDPVMLSDECRMLKVRMKDEKPDKPGSTIPDYQAGTPGN